MEIYTRWSTHLLTSSLHYLLQPFSNLQPPLSPFQVPHFYFPFPSFHHPSLFSTFHSPPSILIAFHHLHFFVFSTYHLQPPSFSPPPDASANHPPLTWIHLPFGSSCSTSSSHLFRLPLSPLICQSEERS